MRPEAQHEAILLKLGWMQAERLGRIVFYDPEGGHIVPNDVPNYSGDLNAIAEARRALLTTHDLEEQFTGELHKIVLREVMDIEIPSHWAYRLIESTAAQQCEALLRTVGKWEECKP